MADRRKYRVHSPRLLLSLLILVKAGNVASECPPPPALSGMTAANYSDNTTGSTAIYRCLEGYVHVNLTTSFVFSCNDQGVWEGPNTTCHYVDCESPPPIPNTAVTYDRSSYQGVANYTCLPGYQSTYPGYAVATCTASGNWTVPTIDCQDLDCGEPPIITNAFIEFNGSSSYMDQVAYQCFSGHWALNPEGWSMYTFSLYCSEDGSWRGVGENVTKCWRLSTYMGCYNVTDVTAVDSSHSCSAECLNRSASFALRNGEECACAETRPTEMVPDANCTMTCGGSAKLCGADPDFWSVYSTFHGCFSLVDTDGKFRTYNRLTCEELCRGEGNSHAAYFPPTEECLCLNSAQPGASKEAGRKCKPAGEQETTANGTEEAYNTSALVSTLELVSIPDVSSCLDLFKRGVILHGHYYLSGNVNPTLCKFYDGSADCPRYWLSHGQHCYRFFPVAQVTFHEAWSQCRELDSHVITVNSAAENAFIGQVNHSQPAYLGMFSHFKTMNYHLLDGSLQVYNNFHSNQPSDINRQCVQINNNWYDDDCSSKPMTVICERSLGTYGCVSLPDSNLNSVYTLEDNSVMTLSYCLETCRGLSAFYAALMNGTKCLCLASLPPTHAKVAWTSCDIPCSGNAYQLCGGHPNVTAGGQVSFAFVIQDVGQAYAKSCKDLSFQGVEGSRLIVQTQDTSSDMNCTGEVRCPYSFAAMGGRCYKYFYGSLATFHALCHAVDSYVVVIDDHEELFNVFNDTTLMLNRWTWLTGVFGTAHGIYRTTNGRAIKGLVSVSDDGVSDTWPCVKYNAQGKTFFNTQCTGHFVCEKGPDYRGCGVVNESASTLVLRDYPEMSVIQCVELCRGRVDKFALIANNPFRCYCTNEDPEFVSGNLCNNFCFNPYQRCGSYTYGYASVFEVDKLPALADNCSDLFDMDVMVPGTYLVNGTPAYCYMKDNSSCSLPNTNEWEGVGLDGVCFKWSLSDVTAAPTAALCHGASSSSDVRHLPASIRSVREAEFLTNMSKTLKHSYSRHTNLLGGLDQFQMGIFTWADGWLMTLPDSAWAPGHPSLDYDKPGTPLGRGYMSLSFHGTLSNVDITTSPRRMICRESKDHLGCVINPSTLTPIISNYSSMSIALCKQTCLAQHALVALLDTGSCYCSDDVDLAGFTGAADTQEGCDVPCPGNSLQSCADPGFLQAYLLDTSDVADSCEILYANFVMLNNTYILRDLTADDSNATVSATCGMSDTTPCPAGFLGNDGSCYRFFPRTYIGREQAATKCFSFGSYLATPSDAIELTYLLTAVTGIPSLSSFPEWQLGIYDYMQGQLVASSDGSLLVSTMWDTDEMTSDATCTTLSVTTSAVVSGAYSSTLPFVCETGPEFMGCRSFSTPPDDVTSTKTFDLSTTSVTVQQCLALCFGQDRRYALLTTTKCYCGNSDVIDTMHSDVMACSSGCRDYFSQACGTDASGIYAVYDADAYSLSRKSAQSCSQYRQALVTAKGQYYLYLNSTSTLLVTCGTYGSGHDDVLSLEGNAAIYTASSSYMSTANQSRLNMELLAWTSWRPVDTDTSRWIQVTLSDYYVIKAIAISGTAISDGGHVTELSVSYGFAANKLRAMENTLAGPIHRSALAVRYLPLPVVAKVVRLQPVTWSVDPSLSFTLLGHRYANFSHFDRYIGCFADPNGTALVSLVQPVAEDGCKDHCSQQGYPLFGVVSSSGGLGRCGCASAVGEYGELDDTSCSSVCGGLPCGDDEAMSVAVFRAYDKRCSDPGQVTGATTTLSSLVPAPDGVYGTGRNVTYACPTGYGMTDMMLTSLTITCQQDNTWDPDPPDACRVRTCGIPDDVPNCHELYTNVTYGHSVTYMCHAQYQTEDGDMRKVSYCTHGGTWQPPPPQCLRQEVPHRNVCSSHRGLKIVGSDVATVRTHSKMDCAVRCMNYGLCFSYSFANNMTALPAETDNCRLYLGPRPEPDLVHDPIWDVYNMERDC